MLGGKWPHGHRAGVRLALGQVLEGLQCGALEPNIFFSLDL